MSERGFYIRKFTDSQFIELYDKRLNDTQISKILKVDASNVTRRRLGLRLLSNNPKQAKLKHLGAIEEFLDNSREVAILYYRRPEEIQKQKEARKSPKSKLSRKMYLQRLYVKPIRAKLHRKYCVEHKEELDIKRKEYYQENREIILEKNKEYYQKPETKQRIKEYNKKYRQRPETKQRAKYRSKTLKIVLWRKEYRQRPEVKKRKKEYNQRAEVKQRNREMAKKRYREKLKSTQRHKGDNLSKRNRKRQL